MRERRYFNVDPDRRSKFGTLTDRRSKILNVNLTELQLDRSIRSDFFVQEGRGGS